MTISQVTVKILLVLWETWNRDTSSWQWGIMGLHSCSSADTPHSMLLVRWKSLEKTHLRHVISSLRTRPSMKPAHILVLWVERRTHMGVGVSSTHPISSIRSAKKVSGLSEQLQKVKWVSLYLENIFSLCVHKLCPLPGAQTKRSCYCLYGSSGRSAGILSSSTSHFFYLLCIEQNICPVFYLFTAEAEPVSTKWCTIQRLTWESIWQKRKAKVTLDTLLWVTPLPPWHRLMQIRIKPHLFQT